MCRIIVGAVSARGLISERRTGILADVQWCEQMGHGELQGIRDADEAQHRDVALAPLNLADVCGTQARHGRERRLKETPLLPILAEGRPKKGE